MPPTNVVDPELLRTALDEYERLDAAASRLYDFVRFTKPGLLPASHQRRIADTIDDLIAGKLGTSSLLLTAAPRSAKSEFASRRTIPFLIGQVEARGECSENIVVSASESLARGIGVDIREIMASAAYARLFPRTRLSQSSAAADEFRTEQGSIVLTRPLGGQIVGRGVSGDNGLGPTGCLVLDDPYKSRLDADSELIRSNVRSYLQSVLIPRCLPGALRICALTPWHELDIVHTLRGAAALGGTRWHELAIPAITAEGLSYWPERFPLETLRAIRADVGEREFAAQYLGKPIPPDGALVKRDLLKFYLPADIPFDEELHHYIGMDLALTEGNDASVIVVFGVSPSNEVFVRTVWRKQTGLAETTMALLSLCRRYRVRGVAVECDNIWLAGGREIKDAFRKNRVNLPRIAEERRSGSKQEKFAVALKFFEEGRFLLPEHPDESTDMEFLLAELLSFGAGGATDDIVDAIGVFARAAHRFPGRGYDLATGGVRGVPRSDGRNVVPFPSANAYTQDGRTMIGVGLEEMYAAGCGPARHSTRIP